MSNQTVNNETTSETDQSTSDSPSMSAPTMQGIQTANASPWVKPVAANVCSLNDVMSEQLAQELQTNSVSSPNQGDDLAQAAAFEMGHTIDTSNDLLIAQMMQHEFDKQFDHEIKLQESHHNADSKVRVSFDNYRAVHPSLWEDDDEPDEEVVEKPEVKEQQRNFRGRGISGKGKDIVTKHDAGISHRKNANRVTDQFPPEINVGDGQDMKLPNKVYNKLKSYSKMEAKRANKLHEKKDHSTAEHSMDPRTRMILYKLVNNGTLDDVSGVVSVGKESVVFHAKAGKETDLPIPEDARNPPPEVAIKVFKTTLTDFKNRADYVKGDVRFFKDEFKKQNPRKIMGIWADKEAINLRRIARFKIPCPKVLLLRKHVLLMTFIGRDRVAAPKLKDAKLSTANVQIAYEQIVKNMKTMYQECLLVHGDLSEYNMLWFNDQVYFIDVSQAVDRHHPHAHEFLLRDCRNVSQFFKRCGAVGILGEYELFNQVTGLNLKGQGKEFLMQVEEYEKNENTMTLGNSQKNYNFDFMFDRATKQRRNETSSSTTSTSPPPPPPSHSNNDSTEHTTATTTKTATRDDIESRIPTNTSGNEPTTSPTTKECAGGNSSDVTGEASVGLSPRDTDWAYVSEDGRLESSGSSSEDDETTDEETMLIFEKFLEQRRLKFAKEQSETGDSFVKVSFEDDEKAAEAEAETEAADTEAAAADDTDVQDEQ